jgi:hypothetical protein
MKGMAASGVEGQTLTKLSGGGSSLLDGSGGGGSEKANSNGESLLAIAQTGGDPTAMGKQKRKLAVAFCVTVCFLGWGMSTFLMGYVGQRASFRASLLYNTLYDVPPLHSISS